MLKLTGLELAAFGPSQLSSSRLVHGRYAYIAMSGLMHAQLIGYAFWGGWDAQRIAKDVGDKR